MNQTGGSTIFIRVSITFFDWISDGYLSDQSSNIGVCIILSLAILCELTRGVNR